MAKTFIGKIVSAKMDKTVIVSIERKLRHPLYKKIINRRKKIKAHNQNLKLQEGDMVEIKETRPISKDKHFIVVNKID